jgi:lysozyme
MKSRLLNTTLFVLVIAVVMGGWLYYAGFFQFNHPPKREFPVRGIDVSHHQVHIGWFKASLEGLDFAYMKATEGRDFRDRRFAYNWDQCQKNNLRCGAYHFFNPCVSGRAQAEHFMATVPMDEMSLPPALDLEFSRNCKRKISRAELKREVSQFVSTLSKRYPGLPVFYIDPPFYKRYFKGHEHEFPKYQLWIRNVIKEPTQIPCTEWTFWQYADRARIEGIRGPVDMNVYCGNAEDFARL